MRILHTSDWHLGKSIHGQDLLPDQKKILRDLEDQLSIGYDGLLIAGDIYDRSIPPSDAVRLFSSFIERMVDLGIETVVIPGNHDSPSRLDFASGVLERSGIHFRCRFERVDEPVMIQDDDSNRVQVFALPFVDEVVVRTIFPDEDIRTHQDATAFLINRMREKIDPSIPSILLSHSYTGSHSIRSESERELLVGDQGLVPIGTFDGFDHVSLGHLHRPQEPMDNVRYSGSLMPYSFSEIGYNKSSTIMDINGSDILSTKIEHILDRRFSMIEGKMNDLLMDPRFEGYRDDYLSIKIEDSGLLIDIHRRLMERFTHVLEIDQPALHIDPSVNGGVSRDDADDPRRLFALFLEQFGWEDGKELDLANDIFKDIGKKLEQREVGS